MTKSTLWANPLKCSWCAKTLSEVRRMIAGPGVYICDECVGLCKAIIDEEPSRIRSRD